MLLAHCRVELLDLIVDGLALLTAEQLKFLDVFEEHLLCKLKLSLKADLTTRLFDSLELDLKVSLSLRCYQLDTKFISKND